MGLLNNFVTIFIFYYCFISQCSANNFIDASDFSWRVPRAQAVQDRGNIPGQPSFNGDAKLSANQSDRRLAYSNPQQARCLDVPSNLTLCGTMGYDRMRIPNFLEQWNLNDIIAEAEVWNKRLAEARCNDAHSRLFLCSVLAPVCVENKAEPVPPCRNICQSVQRTCERPLHHRYGFTWPDVLSCDRFPAEDEQVCIGPDSLESISGQSRLDGVSTTSLPTAPALNKADLTKRPMTTSATLLTSAVGKIGEKQTSSNICSACLPIESVEEVMQRACTSHIAFRSRITKISKRFPAGPTSQQVYDINLGRRIRVSAEQPFAYLPRNIQQFKLRNLLEKGTVRIINVNASGDCSCTSFGDRKGDGSHGPGGMVMIFANAIRDKVRGGQDQVRFEMTGYVQLGQQIDKGIKRFTQKLKRQPLENVCASGTARQKQRPSPMQTTLSPIITTINNKNGYERRHQQQQNAKNRGGQGGRRRMSTSRPDRGHLLAHW